MQKIRNQVHKPLSLTRFVVGSGVILFLTGVILLLVRTTAAEIGAARLNLYWAGWVLTAGWIIKRVEDRQWPFQAQPRGHGESSGKARANLLVVATAVLGAMIWRSYGPVSKEYAPVQTASIGSDSSLARPSAHIVLTRDVVPAPITTLSLTGVLPPQTVLIAEPGAYQTGVVAPFPGSAIDYRAPLSRTFDSASASPAPNWEP
jgi:hypothetical protein